MSFTVKRFEDTPNPNALKAVLDRPISSHTRSFLSPDSAADDPIASRLMAIEGVRTVMLLNDFVTINKTHEARWPGIKKQVIQVLSEAEA